LVSRKLLTEKQLRNQLKFKVNLFVNLVAAVNTVMYGFDFVRKNPGKGFEFINSIKGGVVPQEYIKPVSQGIVSRQWAMALSLDTQLSM
jgi:hypothetical protein